jgi:alpha-tubulin suppressor-like RCC1 family protein
MIGCGAFHSVAVTANGSLFCWGGGANQVAGARVSQSSRRGGGGGGGGAGGATRRLTQDQKTALESEKRLAQLKRLDLGTLKRELGARRLSTIGNRRALQKRLRPALQDEASLGRALREGDVAVPTPVAVGRSVVTAIAVGSDFTLALDSSALVWAWGANNYGQLGQGDLTPRSTPVALSSLRSASRALLASEMSATAAACASYVTPWLSKTMGSVWTK